MKRQAFVTSGRIQPQIKKPKKKFGMTSRDKEAYFRSVLAHQEMDKARQTHTLKREEPKKPPPLTGSRALNKFGYCPGCDQAKWWDNGPAKASGRYKPNAPDAECANCGYKLWPKKKSSVN